MLTSTLEQVTAAVATRVATPVTLSRLDLQNLNRICLRHLRVYGICPISLSKKERAVIDQFEDLMEAACQNIFGYEEVEAEPKLPTKSQLIAAEELLRVTLKCAQAFFKETKRPIHKAEQLDYLHELLISMMARMGYERAEVLREDLPAWECYAAWAQLAAAGGMDEEEIRNRRAWHEGEDPGHYEKS